MKILFDNNLSPFMAHAMGELSKRERDVEEVIHLRDRFAANTPDIDWLGALDGPWVVISADRFAKNHDAEREAIRRAGIQYLFLKDSGMNRSFGRNLSDLCAGGLKYSSKHDL